MCTGAEGLVLGSAGVAALGAIGQGRYAKSFYNYKAAQAEADANAEIGMSEVRARKVRKAGELVQGEARAAYGGAGIDVTQGTPVAVREKIERNVEEDALTQLLTGQRRARVLRAEAEGDRSAASNAMTQAYLSAGSSLLSGAGGVAMERQRSDRWIRVAKKGSGGAGADGGGGGAGATDYGE